MNKPQTTWPLRSTPTAPSRSFTATTNQSASPPRIGTQSLTVQPLGTLPLTPTRGQYRDRPSHVPCRSSRSDSRRLHAGHRPANQRTPAGLIPEHSTKTPVLMSLFPLTTRQQRPRQTTAGTAHRLPDPYLTPSRAPFPASLTTTVFSQCSTRWFGAALRRETPGGLPPSSAQHTNYEHSAYHSSEVLTVRS